eukprot:3935761-Rhodomonas_salina.2
MESDSGIFVHPHLSTVSFPLRRALTRRMLDHTLQQHALIPDVVSAHATISMPALYLLNSNTISTQPQQPFTPSLTFS